MHSSLQLVSPPALRGHPPGHRQQLQRVAKLVGPGEVLRLELHDALGEHLFRLHARAEGELRQDAELLRRIAARDVQGGVGLGEAEPLRLDQRGRERRALLGHRGEDVVRRAVHDPVQGGDAVGGERLAQRPDDRHPAADGALVVHVDALLGGQAEELLPSRGQERLVGGDDVLAAPEGVSHQVEGFGGSADELHDHLDARVVEELLQVRGDDARIDLDGALLGRVAQHHLAHHDAGAEPRLNLALVPSQDGQHSAADRPESRHADADLAHAYFAPTR